MTKFSKEPVRPKTLRDARKASKENREAFTILMQETFQRFSYTKKFPTRFNALLGLRPYNKKPLASDAHARFVLMKNLVKHFDEHQKQNPEQRFFFLTLMSDEFRTPKKAPAIWLKRLRVKTDKVLRSLCKEHGAIGAIGMIECTYITNAVDERMSVFQWHSHAILWADKNFDYAAARKALKDCTSWRCASGMDPIRIKEITPDRGRIAYLGYYMAKLPVDAVNVLERPDGTQKVRKTQKGYRPDVQLRLFEALSRIELHELVFSVEDGKFIRDPVMRNVRAAKKVFRTNLKPIDVSKVRKWFKRLWKGSKAEHRKGWFISI